VRVAFVAGFFSPVEETLKDEFECELASRALVVVGKPALKVPFDVHKFKSQFFQAASLDDRDPILVIATSIRGEEWVRAALEGIVESGRSRGREILLKFLPDTQDPAPIVEALDEFELTSSAKDMAVTEAMLTTYRQGHRILCVRGGNQAGFADALTRAQVQFANFDDHFLEVTLSYGPNVIETLVKYSRNHSCLLYAWGELKYLQPRAKKKWGAVHQGKTPSDAIVRFKQAVLGQGE